MQYESHARTGFRDNARGPGVAVAIRALASRVVGVDAIVRLPASGAPEFGKCIEFEGKARMTRRHDAMCGEFVRCAEMARQAKLCPLFGFFGGIEPGIEISRVVHGRRVVVR